MDAEIQISDVAEAGELREYARRRLTTLIRQQRGSIEGVSLSISREAGRGPAGIRCRISVRLSPLARVYLEKVDAAARAAIDGAVDRLGGALGAWNPADPTSVSSVRSSY